MFTHIFRRINYNDEQQYINRWFLNRSSTEIDTFVKCLENWKFFHFLMDGPAQCLSEGATDV